MTVEILAPFRRCFAISALDLEGGVFTALFAIKMNMMRNSAYRRSPPPVLKYCFSLSKMHSEPQVGYINRLFI